MGVFFPTMNQWNEWDEGLIFAMIAPIERIGLIFYQDSFGGGMGLSGGSKRKQDHTARPSSACCMQITSVWNEGRESGNNTTTRTMRWFKSIGCIPRKASICFFKTPDIHFLKCRRNLGVFPAPAPLHFRLAGHARDSETLQENIHACNRLILRNGGAGGYRP